MKDLTSIFQTVQAHKSELQTKLEEAVEVAHAQRETMRIALRRGDVSSVQIHEAYAHYDTLENIEEAIAKLISRL